MKILLAEDDAISRDLMRRIINLEPGHELVQARDGEEAWRILCEPGRRFDVGIFDLTMPRMDGLGLLERIRGSANWCKLPVILCTAINDRQTIERACLLSVSHYIVKPYTKALVQEKLRLVAADLAMQVVAEDAAVVAERLGVEVPQVAELATGLMAEVRLWLDKARMGRLPGDFQDLAVSANGLKGASLNLGLRGLSRELDQVEHRFAEDFGTEARVQFPPSHAEVAAVLESVATQLGFAESRVGAIV